MGVSEQQDPRSAFYYVNRIENWKEEQSDVKENIIDDFYSKLEKDLVDQLNEFYLVKTSVKMYKWNNYTDVTDHVKDYLGTKGFTNVKVYSDYHTPFIGSNYFTLNIIFSIPTLSKQMSVYTVNDARYLTTVRSCR